MSLLCSVMSSEAQRIPILIGRDIYRIDMAIVTCLYEIKIEFER